MNSAEQIRNLYGQSFIMHHPDKNIRFDTIMDAARYCLDNNIAHGKITTVRTHISEACRGKRKKAYGYNWSFV